MHIKSIFWVWEEDEQATLDMHSVMRQSQKLIKIGGFILRQVRVASIFSLARS